MDKVNYWIEIAEYDLKTAKATSLYEIMSIEQKNIIRTLGPLNIEARYPSVKNDIYSSLNKERCDFIFKQTEELFQWIKNQL